MPDVENPFADEVKFSNVNLKLAPAKAAQVAAFLKDHRFTKATGWSVLLNTALAALTGDPATVAKAVAFVNASKANADK